MDQIKKKTIRINWYSNETIDFKLKVEKTIYYKETNHSKTNNKMTVHQFKKRQKIGIVGICTKSAEI